MNIEASDSDDEVPQLISSSNELPVVENKSSNIKAVPVTILTGFLGAGKTTLLNKMLRSGRRIAVVENEFGAGLDIESLIARDGLEDSQGGNDDDSQMTRLVELSNGCICCSVKDSLVAALESLVARQPHDKPLEHIIVETSGLAHPGPVASLFWVDEELESNVKLDGIVTVVDAFHLPKNLNLNGNWEGFASQKTAEPGNTGETIMSLQDQDATCAAQIAYADRILLNKSDLVDSLVELQETLSLLNPLAMVKSTVQAEVDPSWVLDIHAYEDFDIDDDEGGGIMTDEGTTTTEISNHGSESKRIKKKVPWQMSSRLLSSDLSKNAHVHDLTVGSINVVIDNAVVDLAKLKLWLADLLWEKDMGDSTASVASKEVPFGFMEMEIFRMKGSFGVFEESLPPSSHSLSPQETTETSSENTKAVNTFKYVLQVVHGLFDITETKEKWMVAQDHEGTNRLEGSGESYSVKMVFIGKHLNRRKLELGLKACVEMI